MWFEFFHGFHEPVVFSTQPGKKTGNIFDRLDIIVEFRTTTQSDVLVSLIHLD